MTIKNQYKDILPFIGLVIFALLFACIGEWRPFFFDIDEPKYVTAALEMARSGDWLHPMFGGLPRMEKPPLPYWLAAPLFKIFGTAFSDGTLLFIARIPAILSSVLTIVATYLIGKRLYSTKTGILAALFLTIAPPFKIEGMMLKADIIYTAAVTWATYFYLRRFQGDKSTVNSLAASLATALGVLTKGPFALAPLAGYMMAELLREKPSKNYFISIIKRSGSVLRRETSTILLGVVLGCGPFLLWIWSASSPEINYFSGMISDAAKNTLHIENQALLFLGSFFFYLSEITIIFFPLGALSIGAIHTLLKYGQSKFSEKNIILWTSLFYLILCIFLYRLRAHRYFLPILPLLSVITVNWILTASRDKFFKKLFIFGNVLITGTAVFIGSAVLYTGQISTNLWENAQITNYSSALLPFALASFLLAAVTIISAAKYYHKPLTYLAISFLTLLAVYPFYFNAAPGIGPDNKFLPKPLIGVNLANYAEKNIPPNCLFIASESTLRNNPDLHFFMRNLTKRTEDGYLAALTFDVNNFNNLIMAPVVARTMLEANSSFAKASPLYKTISNNKFRKSVLILSGNELTQLYRNSIYFSKIFSAPAASIPIQGMNISWNNELFYVVFMKGL
ncbi:glycosyltransferase family 39 protein [Maridesulfovibrio frigidus]|uniref:glycosyltransferase family 39 protein n=1 Tax=Maridesulfovibrio frigidus TaxID=340956 RepID=UPI0004E25A88|nr:glycosyltransferase family 39 protein [Maridesulfovibrio frigidus]